MSEHYKTGRDSDNDLADNEHETDELMPEEPEEQEEDLGIQEINDDTDSQDIFDNFEKNQIYNYQK